MEEKTVSVMGAIVGRKIGGEIYVNGLENNANGDLSDNRVNWMAYDLPIDESDLPTDYDGGRWALHASKHGWEF